MTFGCSPWETGVDEALRRPEMDPIDRIVPLLLNELEARTCSVFRRPHSPAKG
ncbi:MAG: hypothetical protein GY788_31545 [bacterium]|nr:hypothetical protein [bacterium]